MPNDPKKLMIGQLLTFEAMETLAFEFEKVLKANGINIQPKSDLERICLNVLDILGKKQNPELLDPVSDIRPYFADVMGLWTFMTKIVRLAGHKDFGQLVPHLHLLNDGSLPQNKRSPVSDQAANKLFELLIALLSLDVGADTKLDHPDLSKGDNPDILTTFNKVRWGFACKTLHSSSPKTLFDRIYEGVEQIEVSPAQRGCVVLNFKNLIDHNHSWPILNEGEVRAGGTPTFGAWPNPSLLAGGLAQFAKGQKEEVETTIGKQEILDTFKGKKAVPAIFAWLQTATGVVSPLGPVPTSIGTFFLGDFGDVTPDLALFRQLNDAMHERPSGTA